MNTTDNTPRKDPLIDAYRQASEREGARPSANVRAAVLAHARVVAQSLPSSTANTTALSDTTRSTVAANEPKPLWRLAAGVVIGLVGVWIFQLTRPSSAPDTSVAAASAPQADKARVAESPASSASAAPAAAQPEAKVAVVAPAPTAPTAIANSSGSRARADGGGSRQPAEPARAEANVAIASAAPPAPFVGSAAATQSAAAAADAAGSEPFRETVVASAELRKSAKVAASRLEDKPAMAAAAHRAPSAAPNAFPAQTAETMIAAAPAPASPPPPAAVAPQLVIATAPSAGVASGALAARASTAQSDTMKVTPQAAAKSTDATRPATQLSEIDQAMFRAVRAGELPALRAAIARGANVNVRDERGRTTLQIARERDDAALVDALQTAGAR